MRTLSTHDDFAADMSPAFQLGRSIWLLGPSFDSIFFFVFGADGYSMTGKGLGSSVS